VLCAQFQRTSGLWYSAEYSTFSIADEAGKYQLTVAGYSGDANNALMRGKYGNWVANGQRFSTLDDDNDAWAGGSCTTTSGWWFRKCSCSNLIGGSWTSGTIVKDVQASRMLLKLNY